MNATQTPRPTISITCVRTALKQQAKRLAAMLAADEFSGYDVLFVAGAITMLARASDDLKNVPSHITSIPDPE